MIGNDTIEIIKRAYDALDAYGNGVPTETAIPVAGCSFQAKNPDEIGDSFARVAVVNAVVYMPVTPDTTAITSLDAIRYNGRTYEMRGPSITTTDLAGHSNHVRALVRWALG